VLGSGAGCKLGDNRRKAAAKTTALTSAAAVMMLGAWAPGRRPWKLRAEVYL
jgi:hypothetical protein